MVRDTNLLKASDCRMAKRVVLSVFAIGQGAREDSEKLLHTM